MSGVIREVPASLGCRTPSALMLPPLPRWWGEAGNARQRSPSNFLFLVSSTEDAIHSGPNAGLS